MNRPMVCPMCKAKFADSEWVKYETHFKACEDAQPTKPANAHARTYLPGQHAGTRSGG
jgi:hypothetical protein